MAYHRVFKWILCVAAAVFARGLLVEQQDIVVVRPRRVVDGRHRGLAPTTTTGSPILIGGICQCTGPLTNRQVDPYKAWIDTVNASGEMNGHPLKFMYLTTRVTRPGQ